jgi:hypothetical protein
MKRRVKIVTCLFLSIYCIVLAGCTTTEERVKDLIGRMQMDEKIGQMIQVAKHSKDFTKFQNIILVPF